MKKSVLILLALASLIVVKTSLATDINVSGNADNSQNSVTVTNHDSVTVNQGGSAQVNTNVDSNASTGNNTANGNSNGDTTIVTGDATTKTKVTNNFNNNQATVPCSNCSPTPTNKPGQPTPTKVPGTGPTPTPGPGGNGPTSTPGPGGGDGQPPTTSGQGGIGGPSGEVMGLAATSSNDTENLMASLVGLGSIAAGILLQKRLA